MQHKSKICKIFKTPSEWNCTRTQWCATSVKQDESEGEKREDEQIGGGGDGVFVWEAEKSDGWGS